MKLFTGILFYFLLCWNQASALSDFPKKIDITGNYSVAEALNFIRPVLDTALKKQGVDPNTVGVRFASHYEAYNTLEEGHLGISCRPKSNYVTEIGYKVPVMIVYNKNRVMPS